MDGSSANPDPSSGSLEGAQPGPRQNTPSGLVALITGILGFVALPLIGSVLALVFGYQSRREAAERPDLYVDDFGRAGRILGWIGVGLAVFFLILMFGVMSFLMPVRMR